MAVVCGNCKRTLIGIWCTVHWTTIKRNYIRKCSKIISWTFRCRLKPAMLLLKLTAPMCIDTRQKKVREKPDICVNKFAVRRPWRIAVGCIVCDCRIWTNVFIHTICLFLSLFCSTEMFTALPRPRHIRPETRYGAIRWKTYTHTHSCI